ncbi:MAG: GatB/YqeY domain-containing protein [Propionivibrio sp.]
MSLKERINEDMKSAMRARETARLAAVRLLLAAIKQKEVDERIELDDAGVQTVIDKMLKQRRDSITQYAAAGRDDLVAAEKFEAEVLAAYMPAALSEAEIDAAVAAAIAATGAAAPGDMGKVMAVLKPELAGRADMSEVSKRVRARLAAA